MVLELCNSPPPHCRFLATRLVLSVLTIKDFLQNFGLYAQRYVRICKILCFYCNFLVFEMLALEVKNFPLHVMLSIAKFWQ